MSLKTFLVGAADISADVAEQGLSFVSHGQSLLPFSDTVPQAGHVATLHSKFLFFSSFFFFFHTKFLGLGMAM